MCLTQGCDGACFTGKVRHHIPSPGTKFRHDGLSLRSDSETSQTRKRSMTYDKENASYMVHIIDKEK